MASRKPPLYRGKPLGRGEGLRCQECHHEFDMGSTVETMQAHFDALHESRTVSLETSWDPVTGESKVANRPLNRAERRRQR